MGICFEREGLKAMRKGEWEKLIREKKNKNRKERSG